MKCIQCNLSKLTVGEIRVCETCSRDGTASQLTEYVDSVPIEDTLTAHPGMANRFLPETVEEVIAEAVAEKAKPKRRKKKAKVVPKSASPAVKRKTKARK